PSTGPVSAGWAAAWPPPSAVGRGTSRSPTAPTPRTSRTPPPSMRRSASCSARSELPLLDDQAVQLGELGHRQGRPGQGRAERATEGAVARGDRGPAIGQHPARVLVAEERGPTEAVQRDRVRRLLADPFDAQQLGAQRRIVERTGPVRALRPPPGQDPKST